MTEQQEQVKQQPRNSQTKKQYTAMVNMSETRAIAVGVKAFNIKQAEQYARQKFEELGHHIGERQINVALTSQALEPQE